MDQPLVESVELTRNVNFTAETINIYDMVTVSLIGADSSDFQGENSDLVESLCLYSCFCVFPPWKRQPARLRALHHTFPNTVRQLNTQMHTHNLHDPGQQGRKQTGTHDRTFNGLAVMSSFTVAVTEGNKDIYSKCIFNYS